jgi:hypothetical protein
MVFGKSPLIKTGARTDGKDKARRAAKFKRASRGAGDSLEHGEKNLLRRIGTVTVG